MINNDIRKNIPYLDGWRGLSIIFVLLAHFFPIQFSSLGELGVLLFFVLSGFLMSDLLFIRKISIISFFVKRFSRVLPTFWLFIFVMVIYSAYIQKNYYHVTFYEILNTLIFLRTYFPDSVSIWSENWPIGHVWSLNVEEHSYVYLAIVAMIF
jgi:peptidoglycan/LPS O-acetylase OafA/YrhL